MSFKQLLFIFISLVILNISSSVSAKKATNNNRKPITKPPAPPPSIPPNKVKPGGGLELFQQSCSSNDRAFTALVPIENPVLTTDTHPTLLFYIPDAADEIHHGEFTLVTADEKSTIYSDRLTLPNTPGIVTIQLPQTTEYALQSGLYHWYFKLYCQTDASLQTYVDVHGWVKKVSSTPEKQRQIINAEPQIWYDSLANVANNLAATPNNPTLQQQWLDLLKAIDLEDLAKTPIYELKLTAPL